jgi:hypothetical protein
MPDLTGVPWFFPALGGLVIVAALAIGAGVRAGRQGRKADRNRALRIAAIIVLLAAFWPLIA